MNEESPLPNIRSIEQKEKKNPLTMDQTGSGAEDVIYVECSNTSEGCPHNKIPVDFLEVHEKFECEFRLVKCDLPGCTH